MTDAKKVDYVQENIFDICSSSAGKPPVKLNNKQEAELLRIRAELKERICHLSDYYERGDAACSAYDLNYGYNADFNKRLISNQITYCLNRIEEITQG